jgi:type IV pilus assembly protein PilA
MFQRFHRMRDENERGFTLIELLVVILIIAILAAIAIPVFLRQREKGWRAQVQSALKNAATAVESFSIEANGNFSNIAGAACIARTCTPAPGGGDLAAHGFTGSADVNVVVVTACTDNNEFCIQATHSSLGPETWNYDSDFGQPRRAACTATP